KLEKPLQSLLDKLDSDEELEIKERQVVLKSQGQMFEKTVEKSDGINKAQQIHENMSLYLQDLDQGSNVEPIMPIETAVRTWKEKLKDIGEEKIGKSFIYQQITRSKGRLVWKIAKRVYLLFSTRRVWYMQQVQQISITILERIWEPDFSEVLLVEARRLRDEETHELLSSQELTL
ncbi:1172_t:CDS:2, partial [Gigaspora rosea]